MALSPSDIVVFDFETSGMSPDYGDRPIEVGAVRLCRGEVVDQFQSLMNPGFTVSSFIESFTGIGNDALAEAPDCETVMTEFADYIGHSPLVAHNASFDTRFLDAEFRTLGFDRRQPIGCSLLVARRLFPDAPNHKLETLVRYVDLPMEGTFHRALADASMTARLWAVMEGEVRWRLDGREVDFGLMQRLSKVPKRKVERFFNEESRQG